MYPDLFAVEGDGHFQDIGEACITKSGGILLVFEDVYKRQHLHLAGMHPHLSFALPVAYDPISIAGRRSILFVSSPTCLLYTSIGNMRRLVRPNYSKIM